MLNTRLQRMMAALLMTALVLGMAGSLVLAAPAAQEVRAQSVTGSIDGASAGDFPKIWLALETEPNGAQTTVLIEWDRFSTDDIGFYVLDEQGMAAVESGTEVREVNLATSNPPSEGPGNQEAATFTATSQMYTIVVFNDSPDAASFTLTTDNGVIVDGSGVVTDPDAAADEEEAAAGEEGSEEAGEGETADEPADEPAADATAEPAEEGAEESAADDTAVDETAAEETAAEEDAEAETTAESAPATTVSTTPQVVETMEMEGELPTQDSQHYLGLTPALRDANITLRMTFEPRDQQELTRRLNFWVLDPQGFQQYAAGDARLSAVAIAAGSTNVQTADNERIANFTASGTSDYTVIVYNASNVPAQYTLTSENATLIDDSGQTLTAQEAQTAAPAADAGEAVTGTETTTGTTTVEPADDTTPATPVQAEGREGEPGGTYTVQAGDTLALIAADIYGDFELYEEICAFNNIADCDLIEVGDVINLPTEDELDTGATAPAAGTTTAEATPEPAEEAEEEEESAPTATESVTGTTDITSTESITGAETVTDTGTTTDTTETDAEAEGDVVDTLVAAGNYRTLLAALDAAGLVDALRAEGPFTVFAPTDAAFEALEETAPGALQELLATPSGQLTQILLYHVSSSELLSEDIETGDEVATLQGDSATLEVSGDSVLINGANISAPDQMGSNGVVHGIDAVLIPPSFGQQ